MNTITGIKKLAVYGALLGSGVAQDHPTLPSANGHRIANQLELGADSYALHAVLSSGSEAEPLQLLSPVLSVGNPTVCGANGNRPGIYPGFQIPIEDEPVNWKFTSQFMTEPLPPEAVRTIAPLMAKAPPNTGMPNWESAYWGDNVERLRDIKARYDPDNIFCDEQSIPPIRLE